jgi:hypothetical protein
VYLYRILKVPDHQLSHDPLTSNSRMISRYHIIQRCVNSTGASWGIALPDALFSDFQPTTQPLDHWFRWIGDFGNAGPDKGQGGKFLFLPLPPLRPARSLVR